MPPSPCPPPRRTNKKRQKLLGNLARLQPPAPDHRLYCLYNEPSNTIRLRTRSRGNFLRSLGYSNQPRYLISNVYPTTSNPIVIPLLFHPIPSTCVVPPLARSDSRSRVTDGHVWSVANDSRRHVPHARNTASAKSEANAAIQ